ncbi:MAG TPA: hypothetical protein VE989_03500 [Sphingomicrobium sp.]|nr:hypothetical protein [Sphingomicrobium sp.]
MRFWILLAGPALLLAACGGNGQADNTINADASLSAESFSSNDVTAIDAVTGDSANMAADVNYVSEFNDLGDEAGGSSGPSADRSSAPRRATGNAADANAAAPEPAANATAPAPATSSNSI